MMLPLVVVSCRIKAVCRSVRETTTATSRRDVSLPDWQTRCWDYFTLGRRCCKNMEGTQKYINEQCR